MIETAPTPMISDALLHALADEYLMLNVGAYGIAFDEYLADSARARAHVQDPHSRCPLLPEQEAVQERVDAAEADAERALLREHPGCECRGGAHIEPLHHHTYHGFDGRRSMFRRQGGAS